MTLKTASPKSLLADLVGFGEVKVWSLLVTIFGDMASGSDEAIDGPTLSAITSEIGIKPEALRVALHRLRKDGWIESSKQGRISLYRLSARARRETASVSNHVYGGRQRSQGWQVLAYEDAGPKTTSDDWLPLGKGLFLAPALASDVEAQKLVLPEATIAPWVIAILTPGSANAEFVRLAKLLGSAPPNAEPLGLHRATALRIMILHVWRRLILKSHPAAEDLLGDRWSGSACRSRVSLYLEALRRPEVG